MLSKFTNWLDTKKISSGTFDPDKFKGPEQHKDASYLEKFNYEVVDQIALALSITSRIDEGDNEMDLENRFYISEAYQYLKRALETLETDILHTSFINKISDPDFAKLRKHRVDELIPLSEKILDKFEKAWATRNDEHKNDIQYMRDLIGRIRQMLNV